MKLKISSNSINSIFLIIIKIFTIMSGILCTAILSKSLTLELYGTYSQLNLIVAIGTSITAIGLMDATNYYYNKTDDENIQKENIDTVMSLQVLIGFVVGICILAFNKVISGYFGNKVLSSMIIFIAFRPMFTNFILDLQILQIAIGKTKAIIVKNIFFSLLRLIAIIISVYITHNIKTILVAFITFDIITTFYFKKNFEKEKFKISLFKINLRKSKEIMMYSIPMGIYIMTNSLSRDIDKLIIGKFCGTEKLAIYSNCATLLPFDIVSSSFLTIIIPIMTKYINTKELKKGRNLFSNYIKIGYITTISFTIVSVVLSKEIVLLLYGEKYLLGQNIFILYAIVDMLKFANLSLILSANGETKTLMKYSIISLCVNFILNILFYKIFGFIGPAISTILITGILSTFLMKRSAVILGTTLRKIIDWKSFIDYIVKALCLGVFTYLVKDRLINNSIHYISLIFIIGIFYVGVIFFINRRDLISSMQKIE